MPVYRNRNDNAWRVVVWRNGKPRERIVHGSKDAARRIETEMAAENNITLRPRGSGYVYFIQCGEDGPIKIGWAKNPESRLYDLQVAHHEALLLRWFYPGTMTSEMIIQAQFRHLHIRGEWFRPGPDLLRMIEKRDLHTLWKDDSEGAME